jgi:hypothetical protein
LDVDGNVIGGWFEATFGSLMFFVMAEGAGYICLLLTLTDLPRPGGPLLPFFLDVFVLFFDFLFLLLPPPSKVTPPEYVACDMEASC